MRPPRHPENREAIEFQLLRDDLAAALHLIHRMEEKMSDLSDRIAANTQAVADNTAATTAAVAKIGSGTPSDAADVAAAVAALDTNTAQIVANTSALNSAQPTPPA